MRGAVIAVAVFLLARAASPWKWKPRWQLAGGVVAGAVLVGIGGALGYSGHDLGLTGGVFRPGSWSTDAGTLGLEVGSVGAAFLKALVYAGLAVAGLLLVASLLLAARDLARGRDGAQGLSWIPRYGLVELLFATVVVEELAFRGVILAALTVPRAHLGGVAWSCVLFGLWHLRPRAGWTGERWKQGARQAVLTALMALPLALVRLMTGSVVAPAAIHYGADFSRKLFLEWKKRNER